MDYSEAVSNPRHSNEGSEAQQLINERYVKEEGVDHKQNSL